MLGMAADKKNTASLIIQMGGDCYPEDEGEQGGRSGLTAAAESVLEAVDKRDADSLAYALKSFIKMCVAESEKEEKSEDDEDEDFLGGYSEKKW